MKYKQFLYDYHNNMGLFVDNNSKPFTGIGHIDKKVFYCYLNGLFIKVFKMKYPNKKDFEQAIKEYIFK